MSNFNYYAVREYSWKRWMMLVVLMEEIDGVGGGD